MGGAAGWAVTRSFSPFLFLPNRECNGNRRLPNNKPLVKKIIINYYNDKI